MADVWAAFPDAPPKADAWAAFPDAPAKTAPKPVAAAMSVNNPPPKILAQPPAVPEDAGRTALEDPGYVPPDARAGGNPLTDQRPPMPAPQGRSWGSVAGEAFTNIPSSAAHFASNLIQPILHPIDTAKSLVALGDAVGSKISRPGNLLRAGDPEPTPEQIHARETREAPADAVGQFFVDRYGSKEGIQNTIATDPVGAAADAATVLSGGSLLPVRGAAMVGKVGAMIDPLTQTGNALKLAGKGVEKVASNTLGMTTGAGPESIRSAGRAGREGGDAAKAFTENMRGDVPIENIVDLAKSGLEKIRQERADAYKAGKADLSKDKTVLDFNDIDTKVGKASEVGTYKGQTTEPKAVAITQEMTDSIAAWKQLDPAEFHTPEGLDALKRRLGNIRDSTQYGSPERVAADRIYKAVRDEVAAQAPGYSKMMEDYALASDKLKEVTKTFSLGEKASGETASRKLQAATRDGAQTSWRHRGELLGELAGHEPTLPYAIAGQSTNALAPRGLVARGGLMATGAGLVSNPLGIAALPAFSPRIVGETVYMAGKAVGTVEEVAKALKIDADAIRAMGQGSFQAGRADDVGSRGRALRDTNALRAAR